MSHLPEKIAQFYYREARLLDERRFLSWLELLAPEIVYTIPVRHNYLGDTSHPNSEEYHNIGRELSPDQEAPFRRDSLFQLTVRAQRALSPDAWSDNPPPRTRRFISNIEIGDGKPDPATLLPNPQQGELHVYSNFMLSFSHHAADNHLYTGQRQDILRPTDNDSFQIVARTIILDWNLITAPTLGLFF